MSQLNMYNSAGQTVGQLELNSEVFSLEPFEEHLHLAVLRQLADKRVGCASTKTRGEVRGGGKKPWKQKGTGRARHGSRRSPIWKGGGITFGPKPRDYSINMNRKMRRLVLREALSAKMQDSRLSVLESLEMEAISTKNFVGLMKNLNLSGKTLFVLKVSDKPAMVEPEADEETKASYENAMNEYENSFMAFETVRRSGRNIEGVKIVRPEGINVYDLLYFDNVVFDKAAIERVEEVLA